MPDTGKEMMQKFEKYFPQLSKAQKEYILNILQEAFSEQAELSASIEDDEQEKQSDDMNASLHT